MFILMMHLTHFIYGFVVLNMTNNHWQWEKNPNVLFQISSKG